MDRNLEQECPAVVGKEPQLLLWADLRAASVKVTIRGIHNQRTVL